jgi:hypothetical protein
MNDYIIRRKLFVALICAAQGHIEYENVIIDDHLLIVR